MMLPWGTSSPVSRVFSKDETAEMKERERKALEWEGRPFNPKAGHGYVLPWNVAKTVSVEKLDRRNPGRADGVTWNADHYICGQQIEGDSYAGEELENDPEELESNEFEESHRPTISISLADMVRPGRPKRSESQFFSSGQQEADHLLKLKLEGSSISLPFHAL
jgi:hypothetical protein